MGNLNTTRKPIPDRRSTGGTLAFGAGIVAIAACCGIPLLLGVLASIGIATLNIVIGVVALALVIGVSAYVVIRRRRNGGSCSTC